jgi:hypothetical protein
LLTYHPKKLLPDAIVSKQDGHVQTTPPRPHLPKKESLINLMSKKYFNNTFEDLSTLQKTRLKFTKFNTFKKSKTVSSIKQNKKPRKGTISCMGTKIGGQTMLLDDKRRVINLECSPRKLNHNSSSRWGRINFRFKVGYDRKKILSRMKDRGLGVGKHVENIHSEQQNMKNNDEQYKTQAQYLNFRNQDILIGGLKEIKPFQFDLEFNKTQTNIGYDFNDIPILK